MIPLAQTDTIRQLVLSTAAKFGAANGSLENVESVDIVRGGITVGRRFQVGGIRAIWLADRDVIVFFAPDGRMLATVSPSQVLDQSAKVA